jgi:hypothetical protein
VLTLVEKQFTVLQGNKPMLHVNVLVVPINDLGKEKKTEVFDFQKKNCCWKSSYLGGDLKASEWSNETAISNGGGSLENRAFFLQNLFVKIRSFVEIYPGKV